MEGNGNVTSGGNENFVYTNAGSGKGIPPW